MLTDYFFGVLLVICSYCHGRGATMTLSGFATPVTLVVIPYWKNQHMLVPTSQLYAQVLLQHAQLAMLVKLVPAQSGRSIPDSCWVIAPACPACRADQAGPSTSWSQHSSFMLVPVSQLYAGLLIKHSWMLGPALWMLGNCWVMLGELVMLVKLVDFPTNLTSLI